MKLRYLLAALLLSAPAMLFAQMRVELEFEQDTYLPHEPMQAIVRIYNSSGQSLKLGRDSEWLSFQVESVDGKIVEQRKPADVLGEFTLPSASRARKMVNLAEAYDLSKFGRYYVSATVRVPEWGESFSTMRPKPVGIATGVTLWESTFGIPSDRSEERPDLRKFQLVQANNKKQLTLYVRITDESGNHTYSIFTLGQLVGFSKPEPQLDRWSNLHVLYQDAAHSFRYFTITPDGMLLARQTWQIGERRPAMTLNAEGRISVTGGVRKVSASDLPPPELASEKKTPSGTALLEGEKPLDADKAVK